MSGPLLVGTRAVWGMILGAFLFAAASIVWAGSRVEWWLDDRARRRRDLP